MHFCLQQQAKSVNSSPPCPHNQTRDTLTPPRPHTSKLHSWPLRPLMSTHPHRLQGSTPAALDSLSARGYIQVPPINRLGQGTKSTTVGMPICQLGSANSLGCGRIHPGSFVCHRIRPETRTVNEITWLISGFFFLSLLYLVSRMLIQTSLRYVGLSLSLPIYCVRIIVYTECGELIT